MKRNHIAVVASAGGEPDVRTSARLAEQTTPAAREVTIKQRLEPLAGVESPPGTEQSARYEQTLTASAAHTMVLIGELDQSSTPVLEAELERLCASGVSAVTLDLSKLSAIDSAGVAVIAFRSRWCRKRGCELALIPGGRAIQRAFRLAGVADALTFTEEVSAEG
jgi:anti-anti-sigma factor